MDVHAHLIPEGLLPALLEGRFDGLAAEERDGRIMLVIRGRVISRVTPLHRDLALRLGPGVQICANVNGEGLGEDRFLPFWETVADLDCFVFIHPNQGSVPALERMRRNHLHNLIGNPLDTTLAMASLIFGGHLERWPNLKVCCAHAGGFLPYRIGRFDHAYGAREDVRSVPRPPSEYFRRLYFDTISHGTPALALLVSQVGTGQVMVGTDYPADMADATPVKSVAALGLDAAGEARVLGAMPLGC